MAKEWISENVKCDLCSHKWIAVYHCDSDKLECPNCENMVYFEGINNQVTGLTVGPLFLSAAIPGGVTAIAPSASGNVVQSVGRAISATSMSFEPAQPIVLV
jgi:hypothetical protein